jgi:4-hydroxybenzoate polyprenyltransferase
MPRLSHWIGQYLLAASTMFALLVAVDLLRGQAFANAWPEALAWAAASAAIFVGARYRQARAGAACAICKDVEK